MKIENDKIIEASTIELLQIFLDKDIYLKMSFNNYLRQCEQFGIKITDKEK